MEQWNGIVELASCIFVSLEYFPALQIMLCESAIHYRPSGLVHDMYP